MRSFVVFCVLIAAFPRLGAAEQYVRGNQVVHTRIAPVVVHRILPPYWGVHVYQGRVSRR